MEQPSLQDRALGAFLGLAIGDALGATVEFMTRAEVAQQYGVHCRLIGGGWLRLTPGQVTDDTEMCLALGRSILAQKGWNLEAACDQLVLWLKAKPVDVGATCRRGIRRYALEGTATTPFSEGDAGNGACVRNLPVVLASLGQPQLFETATLEQCRITHNHPWSDDATLTVGRMVEALLNGRGLKGARDEVNRLFQAHPSFRFEPYPGNTSAFIVDTLQTVFHCFFSTDSFRDCVIKAVNQGGDADTIGALAGMLAGAAYGAQSIPSGWTNKLDRKVAAEIRGQVTGLLALAAQ